MAVQLPYALEDFTAALQESFKTAVGETVEVESFRVQIKTIATIQAAANVGVTFSIRPPQDTRSLVLQQPVVVPPSVVSNYCTTVVA